MVSCFKKLSCCRNAKPKHQHQSGEDFLGGSETTFRLKPVVQRIPPGEEHFVDQECRFWSRVLLA